MAKAEESGNTGNETHGASPRASRYMRAIGRMVLNIEDLMPALTYLEEHARIFSREVPFVQIIMRQHFRRFGHTDGQRILDTVPEHPAYPLGSFNSPLECYITRSRIVERKYGDRKGRSSYLLQIKELHCPDRLRNEQAILLEHMGADPVRAEELSRGFRVPFADVADCDRTPPALQAGLRPLLPDIVRLGRVQLEPLSIPGEAGQI